MPEQVAPNRWRLVTREREGVTRLTFLSANAILHLAARIRAHKERVAALHFWELWNESTQFRL